MKTNLLILFLSLGAAWATEPDLNPAHATSNIERPTSNAQVGNAVVTPAVMSIGMATTNFNLSWPASPDPAAAGYNVYYGPVSGRWGREVILGNVTNLPITGIAFGADYYFWVTCVDSNSWEESEFSPQLVLRLPIVRELKVSGTPKALEATRDQVHWSPRVAVRTAEGWLVAPSNGVPREFYRAVMQP